MKRISLALTISMFFAGVLNAADNQVMRAAGSVFLASLSESVVTVSSSAVTTIAAVDLGVFRRLQDTGSSRVNMFNVLASSTTSGISYLSAGEKYIDDLYFGDIYLLVPAGSASTTVSVTTFKNQ